MVPQSERYYSPCRFSISNIRFLIANLKIFWGKLSFAFNGQPLRDGIETVHMIGNGQLSEKNIPPYKQFMALAG
jgi:hypothetical protein